MAPTPWLFIIAGPNGAGKTTTSLRLLPELGVHEFVNADLIALGVSPFNPELVSIQAGRIMLERIDRLIALRTSFAFETTLSAKLYVRHILRAKTLGYKVMLIFLWLPSADVAKFRVSKRVLEGGHHIPSNVIERRYLGGLLNLFDAYMSIVDAWHLFANEDETILVAYQNLPENPVIVKQSLWDVIKDQHIKFGKAN